VPPIVPDLLSCLGLGVAFGALAWNLGGNRAAIVAAGVGGVLSGGAVLLVWGPLWL